MKARTNRRKTSPFDMVAHVRTPIKSRYMSNADIGQTVRDILRTHQPHQSSLQYAGCQAMLRLGDAVFDVHIHIDSKDHQTVIVHISSSGRRVVKKSKRK